MNPNVKIILLLVIILTGINMVLNAQEFRTNKSGSWSESQVWSQKSGACNCWVPIDKMSLTIGSVYEHTIRISENDTIVITQQEAVKLYGRMTNIIIDGVLKIDGYLDLTSIGYGFVKIILNGELIANGNVSISRMGNSSCSIAGNGRLDLGYESDFKWQGKNINRNEFPNLTLVMADDKKIMYTLQPGNE